MRAEGCRAVPRVLVGDRSRVAGWSHCPWHLHCTGAGVARVSRGPSLGSKKGCFPIQGAPGTALGQEDQRLPLGKPHLSCTRACGPDPRLLAALLCPGRTPWRSLLQEVPAQRPPGRAVATLLLETAGAKQLPSLPPSMPHPVDSSTTEPPFPAHITSRQSPIPAGALPGPCGAQCVQVAEEGPETQRGGLPPAAPAVCSWACW